MTSIIRLYYDIFDAYNSQSQVSGILPVNWICAIKYQHGHMWLNVSMEMQLRTLKREWNKFETTQFLQEHKSNALRKESLKDVLFFPRSCQKIYVLFFSRCCQKFYLVTIAKDVLLFQISWREIELKLQYL